jgi:predicted amidophosphoribosyltransferase
MSRDPYGLPGYDAWKTRLPDYADGPTCETCGGWLRRDTNFALYCPDCADRELDAESQEDRALAGEDEIMDVPSRESGE